MRLSCSPCTGAVTEPVSSQTAEVSYAVILTKQEQQDRCVAPRAT